MVIENEQIDTTGTVPHRAGANERGASLVEYALLVALIAIISIAAISKLGTTVSNQFNRIEAAVRTGSVPAPVP